MGFWQRSQTLESRSPSNKKHMVLRGLVVLGGVVALSLVGMQAGSGTAQAAPSLRYRNGLYVDHGWLCRGWPNGVYHCTRHWHVDRAGHLISDSPSWVPTGGGGAAASMRVAGGGAVHFQPTFSSGPAPRGISQWAYTGHPAYGMSDFRGDPYAAYFGSCTWYAQYRRRDEPLMQLGNAFQWAAGARARGLRTGSMPAVGATVVFQPGVQGASGLGHAGHVEAVYANGWFLESAMSTYWNGGGWGRVSFVYAHAGPGVTFIY